MKIFTPSGMISKTSWFALLLACATAGTSSATDTYMTSEGAGTKDGSSWENARAATQESFQASWDALAPGDTFHVGSGNYAGLGIKATKAGSEGKPVRLIGEDRGKGLPVFTSNYDKHSGGATFFAAKEGVSNFEISGFHLKAYQRGVFIRGKSANIKLSNFLIEGALEGIRSDGGAEPGKPDLATHNLTISDCRFEKFVKRAVRLQGGNYKCRIERCFADAGGKEWGVENFPVCYQISVRPTKPKDPAGPAKAGPAKNDPAPDNMAGGESAQEEAPANGADEFAIRHMSEVYAMEHDIDVSDCVALNCYFEGTKGKSSRYWNGDGFCAERGVKNLRFVRCVSMHNTDGGWDIKADSPEFVDCIAIDNKDNFRLWAGTAKLTNCVSAFAFKRGGSGGAAGLWTKTSVNLQSCTFIDNGVAIDAAAEPDTRIQFKDCIIVGQLKPDSRIKLENSIETAKGGSDPKIPATKDAVWKPGSTIFDSAVFGKSKGFSSTRWSQK